jgi:type I restriction enzyme, S subunit
MSAILGWETKRFDEFGTIFSGSTPSTAIRSFWDGEIVWVTPYDLSRINTPYLHDSAKRITEKGLKGCSATLLPPNSLVMSSRAPIGYVALPTVPFCTNQGCKTMKLRSGINSEFAYYNVLFNIDKVKNLGEGTTFAEISKTALSTVGIPFPKSKTEQTKIAEILSTVDRAIEQTEALIAKQQRLKTGLMQDLLTRGIDKHGNLRSEQTHKFKDSPLGRIPVEWEVKRLGSLLSSINQGWSPDCESDPAAQGEWGVLRTTAVVWEGYQDHENKGLPPMLAPRPHLEIHAGDLLMTRAGPNSRVGVIAYVYSTRSKLMLSDKIYRLVPTNEADGRFLCYALSSSGSQRHLSNLKTGMAESQTNISQEIVKALMTVCPPSEEQSLIADRLDQISSESNKSTTVLAKLRALKTALMQDLLTGRKRVTNLLPKN